MINSQSQEALTRSALYELLSAGFLYPEAGRVELLRKGAGRLAEGCQQLGWHEIADPLRHLEKQLGSLDDRRLEEEYIAVFGHTISIDCPPYETEYDQAHVFQKSQTLSDLGTFYRAFGVSPNPQLKERLDHLSVELEFMNLLTLKEGYAHSHGHGDDKARLCRDAQQKFLANHLAEWTNSFLYRLAQRTGGAGTYRSLGNILKPYMDGEFERFSLSPEPASLENPKEALEDELDCAACPLSEDMPQGIPLPMRVGAKQH